LFFDLVAEGVNGGKIGILPQPRHNLNSGASSGWRSCDWVRDDVGGDRFSVRTGGGQVRGGAGRRHRVWLSFLVNAKLLEEQFG